MPYSVDPVTCAGPPCPPQHGSVNCVRTRRHMRSKMFKGSVFVEFTSVEEADKVRTGKQRLTIYRARAVTT